MQNYLRQENLKSSDEAWLVVDKDKWDDGQLTQLHTWSQKQENYGFALSNPSFEYWLLLHFEDGGGVRSSRNCNIRLQVHLRNYNKDIDKSKFTCERIRLAIRRARTRDNPPCDDWPRSFGSTTVYKVVESILEV